MRIKHIDILRGIAALIVAIFHLARNSDVPHNSFDYAKYGFVGVQIFFVISGFILPFSLYKTGYKTKHFGVFMLKRVIRIYPAYIAAILIGVALTILTGRDLIPIPALLSHLLFLNDIIGLPSSSPVFWTLALEFQFYIIIGLLYSYFIQHNTRSVMLVFGLTFAAFLINVNGIILAWFPFFGIGILTFNKRFTNLSERVYWLAVVALLIIAGFEHDLPKTIAALFAVLFILYGSFDKETLVRKVFTFLGAISYSLYLIHWDLGRSAVRLTRHLPFINTVGVLRIAIGVLFSIFCAWLLYISIERSSAKLSGKLKYKPKS